jgi:hypothetical protein
MHIGLLAPPWIPTPPPAYGGIERVVALQEHCRQPAWPPPTAW